MKKLNCIRFAGNAPLTFIVTGGSYIGNVINEAHKVCKIMKCPITFEFNGKTVIIDQNDSKEMIYQKINDQ